MLPRRTWRNSPTAVHVWFRWQWCKLDILIAGHLAMIYGRFLNPRRYSSSRIYWSLQVVFLLASALNYICTEHLGGAYIITILVPPSRCGFGSNASVLPWSNWKHVALCDFEYWRQTTLEFIEKHVFRWMVAIAQQLLCFVSSMKQCFLWSLGINKITIPFRCILMLILPPHGRL